MSKFLEIGERISLVELLKDNSIIIPLLQRDYVQGRANEYEVRIEFLTALLRYLRDSKPFRDLDFIYGFLDDKNILFPLDGQQRLTTLMLLHWYLANKEKQFDVYKSLCLVENGEDLKTKFSYQNRISSKEFCQKLFILNIDLDKLKIADKNKNNSLSKTIKNYHWYAPTWNFDPTVKNMLIMLDAIHNLFKSEDDYFNSLINSEKPTITFLFMDLGKHNLSDDLYIKMNARGVELSYYENFKAKVESFVNSKEISFKGDIEWTLIFNKKVRKVDFKEYYTHKLDGDWSNMIWNILKENDGQLQNPKEFDRFWTNIFRISFYQSILNLNLSDTSKNLFIGKFFNIQDQLSFYSYSSLFINDKNEIFNPINVSSVKEFVEFMDLLEKDINSEAIKEMKYFSPKSIFKDLIKTTYDKANYQERIFFFAYSEFLRFHKGKYEIDSLQKWIRFIRNLTKSTAPYNNANEFLNSIKYIKKNVEYSADIDEYLRNQVFQEIAGFDSIQYFEEIIKRKLENANSEWHELFKNAELHPYLEGQTKFLLTLSGIDENNCDKKFDHSSVQKIYFEYFQVFNKLFVKDGLNKKYSTEGNFIFERTLLSLNDYTISEGSNKSFLINSDRDISWKRLLKFDKSTEHEKIIKIVFTKLLNSSNITKSLTEIIKENKNTGVYWRDVIISNPKILEFYEGGKRYFRLESNHGFVLLKKERVSGSHAEFESFNFYTKFKDDGWMYFLVSGENNDDFPCSYIDFKYGKKKYGFEFIYRKGKFIIAIKKRRSLFTEEFKAFLNSQGFFYKDYYFKEFSKYSDCMKNIEKLKLHFDFCEDTVQY